MRLDISQLKRYVRFMQNQNAPALRRPATPRKPTQRSRVTNGKSLFVRGGNGRGPWARRMRDIVEAHVSDIGGATTASEAQRSIIRRIATLTVELERIEAKFAIGTGDNLLDVYQRTAGNLRRLLESIGLERRSRDITPTLAEYLDARAEETATGSFVSEPGSEAGAEETPTGESLKRSAEPPP
jgi:hypothetical protein